jgi:ADP-ribosyl-[dinitrogen reductase] hydrolase
MDRDQKLEGLLLGTAVGDALGLPREGLSPRRAERLFGGAPLRYRFLFGRGMVSDDTEHACMTGQALLASSSPKGFARSLAWRLRGWFLLLPIAIGLGTLRAILRLWLGFSPERSGVRSAGNGPAMRAPLLGACLARDPEQLRAYVSASTRLTHRELRAEEGALAIALAAAYGATRAPEEIAPGAFLSALRPRLTSPELLAALDEVGSCLARGGSGADLVAALGLAQGVSGYIVHTAPAALFCWLRSPGDFRRAVEGVILLGGDTDTTAAIVGGLVGVTAGAAAIPEDWVLGLMEWPRSVSWMRRLSARLSRRFPLTGPPEATGPLPLFWPGLPLRNLVFFLGVFRYGLRRFLPPYS